MADPSQLNPAIQIRVPDNTPVGDALLVVDTGNGTRALGFGAPAGGGALTEEAVRDLMGITLEGQGGVTITPNDAGDKVVIGFEGGASASAFVVDPHDPQFAGGAKGDAWGSPEGIAYQVNGAWIEFGVANGAAEMPRVFTEADIGKKLWLPDFWVAAEGRTIVDVVNGRARIDPAEVGGGAFSDWFGGGHIHFVCGTDDTAAIQAAIDYANTQMGNLGDKVQPGGGDGARGLRYMAGGLVQLRSGAGYVIFNSAADFAGGKHGALVMRRRVGFEGGGIGQTILYTPPGSRGHGIVLAGGGNNDAYADWLLLGNFKMICFGDLNTEHGLDGIHLRWAFDGYEHTDVFARVHDICTIRAARHGFLLNGRGETVFTNLQALFSQSCGIYAFGMTDSMFLRCSAGGNQRTGIRIRNSGPTHWVMCKSYYNGGSGDTNEHDGVTADATGWVAPGDNAIGNMANWWLQAADWDFSGNVFCTSCEAQESAGSSWVIESSENMLVNCRAADPGRNSYGPAREARPAVIAGFYFHGWECHGTILSNCMVAAELGRFDVQNMGHANAAVHIEDVDAQGRGPQNLQGDLYFMKGFVKRDGTAWAPNWNGGPADGRSGPGWTNGKNLNLRLNGVAST